MKQWDPELGLHKPRQGHFFCPLPPLTLPLYDAREFMELVG